MWLRRVVLVVGLALVSVASVGAFLVGLLALHVDGEAAAGFSEKKFRGTSMGSSRADVLTVLGEPRQRWTTNQLCAPALCEVWSYGDWSNGFVTWHAVVVFSERGAVVGRRRWYFDEDH